MLNKQNIKRTIEKNKNKIQEFGINKIGLFGSYVRNEQTEKSDIDFLIKFNPEKKTSDNFFDLYHFLEDTFEKKIDLVTERSVSKYLEPYIMEEIEYIEI